MRKMLLVSALLTATSFSLTLPAFANDDDEGGPGMMRGQGCEMMGRGMMGSGGMDSDRMGHGGMSHGMMGSGGMDSDRMGDHHMMGKRGWRMETAARAWLANLKDELKITDAQADVWKSYADAVTARAKAMKVARRAMEDAMDKDSPVDRLDARISGMEAVLESMKAMKPAIEKLYGVLSDEQKKVADDAIGAGRGPM
jgi:hypothetical protein